jgi:bla regulator protein BlaR1
MQIISNLLSDSVVSAFGWTLIHSLWQGTLLMILSFVTFYFLRRYTANLRYAAGVALLSLQVVASVVTFFYYQVKSSSIAQYGKQLTSYTAKKAPVIFNPAHYELPMTFKIQMWLSAHLYELVVCWLIGAAFLLLRFAAGWIFTERLRFNAHVVMDKEWRARFGVITAKMNISKSIEFRETAKILTPMVIGAFSPVVLIPIGLLSGFSTAQVEAILAHELAHIRRNDYLINMFQSFVEVLFFFHPAIWWLSDRIRAEREHCCDDIALAVCGDKMSLAHALVKVAEWQTAPRMAMAFASKRPLLLQRVQRVLGLTPKPSRTFGSLPIMLFAMTLVIGLSVYAVAQKSEKAKEKEKKATKHISQKRRSVIAKVNVENEVSEVVETEPLAEIDVENNFDMEFEGVPEMHVDFDNDSLNKKMNEIHKRMQALQTEMEPLNQRMEEINLEMEKQRFEVERYQREMEKIEWKKEGARELRQDLMEKRSTLLERSKSSQSKTSESELDKQLADFEQQIKAQEEAISQLNSQIAASRKEGFKAEEPIRKMDSEIREIQEKIEEINGKIGLETLGFARMEGNPPVRIARTPRGTRSIRAIRTPDAPPAPEAVRVRPAKPAKVPVAPTPPPPPPKKL